MVAGTGKLRLWAAAGVVLCALPVGAQTPESLRDRAKNGVVMIESKWPTVSELGAGTVIAVSGQDVFIVTAAHVVRAERIGKATNVRVQFKARPTEWYAARVLDTDAGAYDIAALRVPLPEGLKAEQIGGLGAVPANSASRGTNVYPIGYPGGIAWSDPGTPGTVVETRRDKLTFQSTVVRPGHSGGPLLDTCGRIVGMVVSKGAGDAEAVPTELVVDLLKEWLLPTTILAVQPTTCIDASSVKAAGTITDVRRMHASEQWRESLPVLDRLLSEQPRSGELLALRSHAYSHLEQKVEALRDGELAVQTAPRLAEAYVRRGEAKSANNRQAEAIADYDKAIELDKNEAEAWANKGAALDALGQYAKAIDAFDRALALQTGRYEYWAGRGVAHGALRNSAAALSDFGAAIRLHPDEALLYYLRGSVYANVRQFDPALADAEHALTLKPDDPQLLTLRGSVLFLLGRRDAARQDLTRALRLDPNVPDAKEMLKMVDAGGGAGTSTGSRAGSANPAAPPDQYVRMLSQTGELMGAGRWADASRVVDDMIRLDASRSEAWAVKGMLALNAFNNPSAAHESFENALSRGGTIFVRVAHDHGSEQLPAFGSMGISPTGLEFSDSAGHNFMWPFAAITDVGINTAYGALVGMFHIRVETDRRTSTFNFVAARTGDTQYVARRPDAEMIVAMINRLRQSRTQ